MASDASLFIEARLESSPSTRREARARADFAQAVLTGLSHRPRSIPCRFLYDARGSELFEEITKLDEYYPTRVETAMLQSFGAAIAELSGPGRVLVEFGSGSSRKTSLLIEALGDLPAYIPIDIEPECLIAAAERLGERHEDLAIFPLVADFTKTDALPRVADGRPRLGFFSGSTIGNLSHDEAIAFLLNAARLLGRGSLFLIGVDLKKRLDILLPAYDDADGVTAAFSLNMLARINRELCGNFDLSCFAHRAIYNDRRGRIEIYLESLAAQRVAVLGSSFTFAQGERVHIENSHKYSVPEFQALAAKAGWQPVKAWTDGDQLFSLHLLQA